MCQGRAGHDKHHSNSDVAQLSKMRPCLQGALSVVRRPTQAGSYSQRSTGKTRAGACEHRRAGERYSPWAVQAGFPEGQQEKEPKRTSPAEETHQPRKVFLHCEQPQQYLLSTYYVPSLGLILIYL